ncbi:MAG: SelB C-terminal domain-containing protein, partial [Desulfofustis sp.]|nr:SelB C-terminal domain-containing protein [Desulfofustis sp.]
VKNMVAGVTGMDLLAFVIAADEGIMPQTREHFDICRLLGVREGFVVITKKDLVDEDWLEMVIEEVGEFCSGSFLEGAPIVAVSSISGDGLDRVVEIIDQFVRQHQFTEAFGPFRLPIDRVFAMKGFGAVVTGTSVSGRTALGDELQLYPGERTAKVRGIQVHSQAVDVVEAGHRTAINLQGTELDEIERGMVLATPGCLEANFMLDCILFYLPANSKPLKHRSRVRVHLGTAELIGRISLLTVDEVKPGEQRPVQLLLEEPVAVWPGDRYVVRSYSPVVTIGGGEVLGSQAPKKRKRLTAKDRTYNERVFQLLQDGTIEEKLLLLLTEAWTIGLTFDQLAVRLGLFGKQLTKMLGVPLSAKRIVVVDSAAQRYLAREAADEVTETIVSSLRAYHQSNPLKNGLSKEEVRSGFKHLVNPKVFNYCLNDLLRKEVVVQEESVIRLATHQVALKADEKQLRTDLQAWYRQRGLMTPTVKETYERFADYPVPLVKSVIDLLLKDGTLMKVSEALYFDTAHLQGLQEKMESYLKEHGEIDAPGFKDLSGLTRKFSIPILEYLDRIKLTIRVGDKRVLRKKS